MHKRMSPHGDYDHMGDAIEDEKRLYRRNQARKGNYNLNKDAVKKRDNIDNEYTANYIHYEVGKEARNSIKRLGGIMSEAFPMPKKV